MTPSPNFPVDPRFWRGRRVFVTGHTGFKGSWLTLWLHDLGAKVTGYALPPDTEPSLFHAAGLAERCSHVVGDIRDHAALAASVAACRPEVVLHLAAQPLVRRSYRTPRETFEINVQGTANLLEACRTQGGILAVVVVSSDKCYANQEWPHGYRETDRLGGLDPYSASKACTELVTAAYRASFPALPVASARAGNVFGGGDWSEDRLIPDAMRAFARGDTLEVRSPQAERPWQHVVEPLAGYLMLARALAEAGASYAHPWNFGPGANQLAAVRDVVAVLAAEWGEGAAWQARPDGATLHEASLLHLDASLAARRLSWHPSGRLREALAATVRFHRNFTRETPSGLRRRMRAERDTFGASLLHDAA